MTAARGSSLSGLAAGGSSLAALAVTALILGGAVVGPFVTPQAPDAFIGAPFDPPSIDVLLGTDALGRDVLSRLLAGGWRILTMALTATVLGVAIGAFLGVLGGFRKGVLDDVIMRASDVALSFPQTILALLCVSIVGPSPTVIVLLTASIHAPQVARVIRSVAMRVAEEDYVRYSDAIGLSTLRILLLDIVPNVIGPLTVEFGLRLTYSIALITSLGFLGLAADPSVPDWGLMINENRIGLASNPWGVAAPVIILAMLTISVNLLFDGIAAGRFRRRPRRDDTADDAPEAGALGSRTAS